MIRSYWELHFGEQHNSKKGQGVKVMVPQRRVFHENRIDVSPATGWRRSCMGVTACLSMDQGKLLKEHRGIEAGSRKKRGSDDESRGAQLPKSKASNQKECGLEGVPQCRIGESTDRKERDADARQRIGGS
ncbi:hypothetical protein BHM03_00000529 [Ensete ventricosum]|nr:hypothetical protein BHM03_00000529 [Ensete ventricosum]